VEPPRGIVRVEVAGTSKCNELHVPVADWSASTATGGFSNTDMQLQMGL
jgi:hypothetical protein